MLFSGGESNVFEAVTHLVFQLGVILIMAKVGGEVFTRFLKLPAVIGELLIGVVIGPYALGNYINLGKIIPGSGLGTLFPKPDIPTEAISLELFSVSEIAVIVLLFFVGLETNLGQFMRYAKPGLVIALGGVIAPFILGVVATIMFGYADSIGSAEALFMGAAMTATSVGITARVLSERKKLATPEGVTILAAAVIDDILGILILTLAVGVADTGAVSLTDILIVGGKAAGFLVVWFGGGLLVSKYLSKFILSLKVTGAAIVISLGLALLSSGLAESFGLAFIIGAYATGLALSGTKLAEVLVHSPEGAESGERRLDPSFRGLARRPSPHLLRSAGNAGGRDPIRRGNCVRISSLSLGHRIQGIWLRSSCPGSGFQQAGRLQDRVWDASEGRSCANHCRHRPKQGGNRGRAFRGNSLHDYRDHPAGSARASTALLGGQGRDSIEPGRTNLASCSRHSVRATG